MAAIVKEYKELQNVTMFGRVFPNDITSKQNQDSLHTITLIKDK